MAIDRQISCPLGATTDKLLLNLFFAGNLLQEFLSSLSPVEDPVCGEGEGQGEGEAMSFMGKNNGYT